MRDGRLLVADGSLGLSTTGAFRLFLNNVGFLRAVRVLGAISTVVLVFHVRVGDSGLGDGGRNIVAVRGGLVSGVTVGGGGVRIAAVAMAAVTVAAGGSRCGVSGMAVGGSRLVNRSRLVNSGVAVALCRDSVRVASSELLLLVSSITVAKGRVGWGLRPGVGAGDSHGASSKILHSYF